MSFCTLRRWNIVSPLLAGHTSSRSMYRTGHTYSTRPDRNQKKALTILGLRASFSTSSLQRLARAPVARADQHHILYITTPTSIHLNSWFSIGGFQKYPPRTGLPFPRLPPTTQRSARLASINQTRTSPFGEPNQNQSTPNESWRKGKERHTYGRPTTKSMPRRHQPSYPAHHRVLGN